MREVLHRLTLLSFKEYDFHTQLCASHKPNPFASVAYVLDFLTVSSTLNAAQLPWNKNVHRCGFLFVYYHVAEIHQKSKNVQSGRDLVDYLVYYLHVAFAEVESIEVPWLF